MTAHNSGHLINELIVDDHSWKACSCKVSLFFPLLLQEHSFSCTLCVLNTNINSKLEQKLNILTFICIVVIVFSCFHLCLKWAKLVLLTCGFFLSLFRNRGERRMSAFECMRRVYQTDGLRGFYRGMSASYAGISETVIHFVIYENIKRRLLEAKAPQNMDEEEETSKDASDFVGMMLAAATSKTCATSIAYPHGKSLWLAVSWYQLI